MLYSIRNIHSITILVLSIVVFSIYKVNTDCAQQRSPGLVQRYADIYNILGESKLHCGL